MFCEWILSEVELFSEFYAVTFSVCLSNICTSISEDDGDGLVTKSCLTLMAPWTVACQAPLSMGFFRQEYWSGLTFPFSRGSFQTRNWTQVSCTAGIFFTNWTYDSSDSDNVNIRPTKKTKKSLWSSLIQTQRDGMGREEGSGWGTHVYLWQIHFDIWQNQYNIVKLNKIKLKKIL